MKFGILTSGGDCPGLNSVIRAVVLKGTRYYGAEFVGFKDGWRGLIENDYMELTPHEVRGLNKQGGTILGTSRVSAFADHGGPEVIEKVVNDLGLDGIIAIGGDGTMACANRIAEETSVNILGVPKTIDNDISATDYTFGFDTAVSIATEAMDRIRTTGDSHNRCMVVEVMGRNAGWIALYSGLAAGAHAILIPEHKVTMDEIVEWVDSVKNRGRAPLVVVAEGFMLKDQGEAFSNKGLDGFNRPRLGGIAEVLAPMIEKQSGMETRSTVLGHIQRGGSPTAFDRVLAIRLGTGAIDAAAAGQWNNIVVLRGRYIQQANFKQVIGVLNPVPEKMYQEATVLFG
ncbi:MAG: ATP-dependent 6-phosphofructokinase [Micrococcaceae bacterium]